MPTITNQCALFTAIRGFGIVRSRLSLIEHFISRNWSVVVATVEDEYTHRFANAGAVFEELAFRRGSLSPTDDIRAFTRLWQLYSQYQPNLVHTFHAKPTIFGGLNTYIHPQPLTISTITGLGHAFVEGGYTRALSAIGYRLALRRNAAVIFQNPDDMQFFLERGWVSQNRAKLIRGSGVDTGEFRPKSNDDRNNDSVRILMVTRLIWQKGVREFVTAAESLKEVYPEAQFYLAGEWDEEHPDGIPREWVQSSESRGSITFLGYIENMPEELRRADIFVLPSYREGLPRVLLEASACRLPVITTDTPGCRDAVIDGVTGILIPPKDHQALAGAIRKLIESPGLRSQMGQQGRGLIEERYDINAINGQYLDLYASLGVRF